MPAATIGYRKINALPAGNRPEITVHVLSVFSHGDYCAVPENIYTKIPTPRKVNRNCRGGGGKVYVKLEFPEGLWGFKPFVGGYGYFWNCPLFCPTRQLKTDLQKQR